MTSEENWVDAGTAVIDSNGDLVATVESVQLGTVFVDPHPGIDRILARAMGWHQGTPPHALKLPAIDTVSPAAIHLRSNL